MGDILALHTRRGEITAMPWVTRWATGDALATWRRRAGDVLATWR